MNPDQFSRDELEARLTALILGELTAEEARQLRATIAQDPELARLHDQLASTIGLVRTASASAADPAAEAALKLSAARREELLAHFKTPRPDAAPTPPPVPVSAEPCWRLWLRTPSPAGVFATVFATLFIVAVLAAMLMPSLALAKRKVNRGTLGTAALRQQAPISQPGHRNDDLPATMTVTGNFNFTTNGWSGGSALAGREAKIVLPPDTAYNGLPPGVAGGRFGSGAGSGGQTTILHPQPITGLPAEVLTIVPSTGLPADAPPETAANGSGSLSDKEAYALELRKQFSNAAAVDMPGRMTQVEKSWAVPTRNTTYAQRKVTIVNSDQFYSGLGGGNGAGGSEQIEAGPKAGLPPGQSGATEEPAGPAKNLTKASGFGDRLAVNKDQSDAANRFYANAANPPPQAVGSNIYLGMGNTGSSGGSGGGGGGGFAGYAGAAPAQPAGGATSTLHFDFAAGNAVVLPPSSVGGIAADTQWVTNLSSGETAAAPTRSPVNGFISHYAFKSTNAFQQDQQDYAQQAAELAAMRSNVNALQQKYNLYGVNAEETKPQATLNNEQVSKYEGMRIEGEKSVKELETQVDALKKLPKSQLRDVLPQIVPDSELAALQQKLHDSEAAYAKAPKNATAAAAKSQIDLLNKQINARVDGLMAGMETKVAATKAGQDELVRLVEEAKQHDQNEVVAAQPYWDEKGKLERLENLHTLLANKIEAEKLDVSIPKSPVVSVIDYAAPDKKQTFWQKLTGQYQSTARIKVERDESDVAGFSANDTGVRLAAYDPYFIQTTFEVMQSEVMLSNVVNALALDKAWAKNNGGVALTTREAMNQLRDRLTLAPVKNTKLVSISVTSDDPQEAARIANTVAAAYQQYRQDQLRNHTVQALGVLQQEYAEQEQAIALTHSNLNRLNRKSGTGNGEPAVPIRRTAPNAPVPPPEIQTSVNAFSTFSLNVSDVSFQLAAASLENGQLPEAAAIRSEEFINAFDYRDPEAPAGTPIAFTAERAGWPFAHHRDLLRFSLKTGAAGRAAGRPLNLVLLLDNSGSMERADRVAIIREALRVLAAQLHPQDTVSVVTFARTARLWVDGVAGDKAGAVFDQVGGLTPQGGTNLEEAMRLAYETARRHFRADGQNRVVLLTDGAANLGAVDANVLKQKVEANRQQGIALDCFGIGWEDYNDDLLEQLSSHGDGRYAFLNSPAEAAGEFAAKLAGALQVAAEDVKVQVEFNPERVVSYRQIGYAKHQLTKEQFRDNSVSAAPIAAQEAGNALYTVELRPDGTGPVATVHVRYRTPGTQDYHEHEWVVPYTGTAPVLAHASAAMRLAGTAGAFAEWLATSPYAQAVTPDELLGYLNGVPETYGADPRPQKLAWMIRQAKSQAGK